MDKEIKQYYCGYCDKEYNDDKWTNDHIIPKVLGGNDSFPLMSCMKCNNELGRIIEYPATQSIVLRNTIINLAQKGHNVKTRRKRDFIPLNKNRPALYPLGVASIGYSLKNHSFVAKHLGSPWKVDKTFATLKSPFSFIFPEEKMTEKEELAISALAYKIALGSCIFQFGKDFSKSKYYHIIKRRIWKPKKRHHLHRRESGYMAIVSCYGVVDGELNIDREHVSNYSNPPDHTLYFYYDSHTFFAIVNLFGEIEFALDWADNKEEKSVPVAPDSKILQINTSNNKLEQYQLEQYKKINTHKSTCSCKNPSKHLKL